jgi:hypothetical protein
MRHELVEALSAALFAIALLALEKLLPFHEPYNILVAAIAGTIAFALLFAAFWRFRHSRMVRNFSDDLHVFVGDWLETWHDGEGIRYSIANITFDETAKKYQLYGESFDERGNRKHQWASHCLHYDKSNCRFVYVSDGRVVKGGRIIFGATCLLMRDSESQNGPGFFIDDSSGTLSRFDFQWTRISQDLLRKTDPTAWIVQYHSRHSGTGAT